MDKLIQLVFSASVCLIFYATGRNNAVTDNLAILIAWPLLAMICLSSASKEAKSSVASTGLIGAALCFYYHVNQQRIIISHWSFGAGWLIMIVAVLIALYRNGFFTGIPKAYREMLDSWRAAAKN